MIYNLIFFLYICILIAHINSAERLHFNLRAYFIMFVHIYLLSLLVSMTLCFQNRFSIWYLCEFRINIGGLGLLLCRCIFFIKTPHFIYKHFICKQYFLLNMRFAWWIIRFEIWNIYCRITWHLDSKLVNGIYMAMVLKWS